jgi:hypothetical protein
MERDTGLSSPFDEGEDLSPGRSIELGDECFPASGWHHRVGSAGLRWPTSERFRGLQSLIGDCLLDGIDDD